MKSPLNYIPDFCINLYIGKLVLGLYLPCMVVIKQKPRCSTLIFHSALWKGKDGAGLNTAGQHKTLTP